MLLNLSLGPNISQSRVWGQDNIKIIGAHNILRKTDHLPGDMSIFDLIESSTMIFICQIMKYDICQCLLFQFRLKQRKLIGFNIILI